MKKQELIDLGIADDIADKILNLHSRDVETHKTKVTEAESARDQFKTQLDSANQQIEGFKGMKKPEEVDAAVNEWKTKYEKAETDARTQLAQVKFDHALESALTSAKVRNVKTVAPLLSRDKLILQDDGTITGLEDQLKVIREKDDYLFESDKPTPKIVTGGTPTPGTGNVIADAARAAANLPPPK